jgi:hypothetical protein
VVVGQRLFNISTATDLGNKKWRFLHTAARPARHRDVVATHVNNEICTWVRPPRRSSSASASELNLERLYRAVSINTPSSSPVKRFTHTGNTLQPYTAVHIKGTGTIEQPHHYLDSHADRRPLGRLCGRSHRRGERIYEIDILNAAKPRSSTLTSTSPSIVYTAAQQSADFGSPPASVNIVIYQMSAIIGRGFASSATV